MSTNDKEKDTAGKPRGNKPPVPKFNFNFYWIYALIAIAFIVIQVFSWNSGPQRIAWYRFENEMMKEKDVEKLVVVNNSFVEVYIRRDRLARERYKDVRYKSYGDIENPGPHFKFDFKSGSVENFEKKIEEMRARFGYAPEEIIGIEYEIRENVWRDLFNWIFPLVLVVILWMFIMRRMSGGGSQIFNIGKSRATLFDKDLQVKVTFDDVAGLDEAKVEVKEIVDFLKNPKKYTMLGGKIPRGALLVGPPGTGKTLLAKAVAGEAQVPFFSLSGSDFVEMFVGVGASRVRDLFRQAKEKAPCIVFIDEIDAVGRARGKAPSFGANDERESTLNQLLTEMDGFATNSGVIILAATNRAEILDRALLRPGRFDRQIFLDLPDLNGRKEIFKVHLKPLKTVAGLDIDFLARQTPGFSGADIANLCNEAALIAARKNKMVIDKQDFLDAVDRIVGGLEKKNKIISAHEKKVIAYHESGHAAISWLMEHTSPLVKVTIVPRGRSLGAAWYLPEERQITTKEQIFDEICAALGGRAAEEITFGSVSTGALSDLEKITKQAYAMVSIFGLNEKIGNISFYDSTGGQEYAFTKPYSEKTAEVIDAEVSKIIESAYQRTKEILMKHRDKLDKLATVLLEKEVIFQEDLEQIFGKRPWPTKEEREKAESAAAGLNGSAAANGSASSPSPDVPSQPGTTTASLPPTDA